MWRRLHTPLPLEQCKNNLLLLFLINTVYLYINSIGDKTIQVLRYIIVSWTPGHVLEMIPA